MIETVEHPISKSGWMISHQNDLMIPTRQNETCIRAAEIRTCHIIQAVLIVEAPQGLNLTPRKGIQIAPHQITEARLLVTMTVNQETVQARRDTWTHQPRLVSTNVQTLQAQVLGTQVHPIKLSD